MIKSIPISFTALELFYQLSVVLVFIVAAFLSSSVVAFAQQKAHRVTFYLTLFTAVLAAAVYLFFNKS